MDGQCADFRDQLITASLKQRLWLKQLQPNHVISVINGSRPHGSLIEMIERAGIPVFPGSIDHGLIEAEGG